MDSIHSIIKEKSEPSTTRKLYLCFLYSRVGYSSIDVGVNYLFAESILNNNDLSCNAMLVIECLAV